MRALRLRDSDSLEIRRPSPSTQSAATYSKIALAPIIATQRYDHGTRNIHVCLEPFIMVVATILATS